MICRPVVGSLIGVLPSACTAARPEGIGKTSHQMRGCGVIGGGSHGVLGLWVVGSIWTGGAVRLNGSIKHCAALVAAILSVTYFAVVEPGSVTLGSKTCVIWNGLMWMWNG